MLQQTMEKFKKCSAILRGDLDVDDLTIKSPLLEMNRLSSEVYRYTGLVKVRCPVLYILTINQSSELSDKQIDHPN